MVFIGGGVCSNLLFYSFCDYGVLFCSVMVSGFVLITTLRQNKKNPSITMNNT